MKAARACFLALLMCWAFMVAAVADVAVPPLVGRVVDQTGTLSTSDADALQQAIRAFEARKGSQIAVLIVPTTAPETIDQYSIRVAEAWKIGRKKFDDGVLLVIAKNDRKLRIEVGYGLEGALTDATSKRIIDEIITPKFRSGDFAGGISAGVDRIMRIVEGEKLPEPVQVDHRSSDFLEGINPLNPFFIFGLFIAGSILRSMLGRLFGAVATAGLAAFVVWMTIGVVLLAGLAGLIVFVIAMFGEMTPPGRSNSGGWSGGGGSYGGGYSGGSSSSSSDSGGGGGSFGGGGASGSW